MHENPTPRQSQLDRPKSRDKGKTKIRVKKKTDLKRYNPIFLHGVTRIGNDMFEELEKQLADPQKVETSGSPE